MTPDFNVADAATWPVVLTVEHVAAIYSRSVGGVRKACQRHQFIPAANARATGTAEGSRAETPFNRFGVALSDEKDFRSRFVRAA